MEQLAPNQIPIMTLGDLLVEGLKVFEMACWAYFWSKNVPEEDQVERIMWGFQDPRIQQW